MSLVDVRLFENKLVGRREIKAKIEYKTPLTREQTKELLANHFKVDGSLIVVRSVNFLTGTRVAEVEAHVYDSQEKLKTFEPLYILVRNKLAERPKK